MVAIRIATVVMRVMVHHVYHVYEASPQRFEGSSHKRDRGPRPQVPGASSNRQASAPSDLRLEPPFSRRSLPSDIGGPGGPITDLTFCPAMRSHTKPSPIGLRMKPIRPLTIPYH